MKSSIHLYEITLKNLYSQLSNKKKKFLSLEEMDKLNELDPSSKFRKKDVAGSYLHWIIKDYFTRYLNTSVDTYISGNKNDITLLLNKYHNFRNKGLVSSPDISLYSYESLKKEMIDLEEYYGIEVFHTPIKGRDYLVLSSNNDYIVYESLNAEGSVFLGEYTNWCISKRKTFFPDTAYRKKEGGKTLIIKSIKEKNSNPLYSDKCEFYCVTSLPSKEIDEIVNANNDSISYTEREELLTDLVRNFL